MQAQPRAVKASCRNAGAGACPRYRSNSLMRSIVEGSGVWFSPLAGGGPCICVCTGRRPQGQIKASLVRRASQGVPWWEGVPRRSRRVVPTRAAPLRGAAGRMRAPQTARRGPGSRNGGCRARPQRRRGRGVAQGGVAYSGWGGGGPVGSAPCLVRRHTCASARTHRKHMRRAAAAALFLGTEGPPAAQPGASGPGWGRLGRSANRLLGQGAPPGREAHRARGQSRDSGGVESRRR